MILPLTPSLLPFLQLPMRGWDFSVLETAIQTRDNQAKENQKTVLWFLYSFVVGRSGWFTQLQMGKKDKSLRKGGDMLAYLFESLTFVSLQMESTEAKRLI